MLFSKHYCQQHFAEFILCIILVTNKCSLFRKMKILSQRSLYWELIFGLFEVRSLSSFWPGVAYNPLKAAFGRAVAECGVCQKWLLLVWGSDKTALKSSSWGKTHNDLMCQFNDDKVSYVMRIISFDIRVSLGNKLMWEMSLLFVVYIKKKIPRNSQDGVGLLFSQDNKVKKPFFV